MNNNRNNNNRRRGRGNRPQGQGGSGPVNRIDSRARGNAPQMLEKYKKLAQDAQHNGDRVQAEYYLQFADHYYRVMADTRLRQEETRPRRNDERADQRQQANDDFGGEDEDTDLRDEPQDDRYHARGRNDDRPRSDERGPVRDHARDDSSHVRDTGSAVRDDDRAAPVADELAAPEPVRRGRPRNITPRPQPQRDNTFGNEGARKEEREERAAGRDPRPNGNADAGSAIDASVLPPAFNVADAGTADANTADSENAEPAVRATARRRRVKPVAQDDGAAITAHG